MRGDEADQLAVVMDGPEHRDVVRVRTGHVRVVHRPDVTLMPLRLEQLLGQTRGRPEEVAEEHRTAVGLAHDAVLGVEQDAHAILQHVGEEGLAEALQRRDQLVGGALQLAANDLDVDRVNVRCAHLRLSCRG